MFVENKYTKIYYRIIEKAKNREKSTEVITEKHHIIPKSFGGSNNAENLVYLTLREHYICHILLTKMTIGVFKRKMCWALHRLSFSGKLYSKSYELARKIHRENARNSNKNIKNREEWKENIAKSFDVEGRREINSTYLKKIWEDGILGFYMIVIPN